MNLAFDNGVKPDEISEIITHLAFYSGWPNGVSPAALAKDVFSARNIRADQLSGITPTLLPLNEAAEAQRAANVGKQFGEVAPGIVQYTTDVLFRDLRVSRRATAVSLRSVLSWRPVRSLKSPIISAGRWIMGLRESRPVRL